MTLRATHAALLAAATFATVTACSTGTKTASVTDTPAITASKASASTSSSAPAAPPTAVDPTSQLLTVQDLPTGWAIDNSSSSATTPACLQNLKTTFAATKDAKVNFTQGSTPALTDSIGSYATPSEASAAFTRGATLLNGCTSISFTANGNKYTGSIGAMSYPKTGDQSQAWSMTLNASGVNIGADIVILQKGSELTELALLDLGSPSTDDLTTFVNKAYAKMM